MSFIQQLIASAIGAFLGFSFSLILFWFQKKYEDKKLKNSLKKNLQFEMEYNINVLKKYLEKVEDCISQVNADSKSIYLNLDYSFIGRYHSKEFYNHGLISDYFHHENVRRWNIFLLELGEGNHNYINKEVEKWRKGKIEKEDIYLALNQEKKHIKYGLEMCEFILTTVSSK